MSKAKSPVVAIVMDGGLPEYLVVDDWPKGVAKPEAVCVDMDPDRLSGRCHMTVDYNNSPEPALCHEVGVFESGDHQSAASGIEPRAALEEVRKEVRRAGVEHRLESLEREIVKRLTNGAERDYFASQLSEIRRDLHGGA